VRAEAASEEATRARPARAVERAQRAAASLEQRAPLEKPAQAVAAVSAKQAPPAKRVRAAQAALRAPRAKAAKPEPAARPPHRPSYCS